MRGSLFQTSLPQFSLTVDSKILFKKGFNICSFLSTQFPWQWKVERYSLNICVRRFFNGGSKSWAFSVDNGRNLAFVVGPIYLSPLLEENLQLECLEFSTDFVFSAYILFTNYWLFVASLTSVYFCSTLSWERLLCGWLAYYGSYINDLWTVMDSP